MHYWIVAVTWGGRELDVEAFLKDYGIEVYVPISKRLTKPKHKKQPVEVKAVAFPGYAFVRMDSEVPGWGAIERAEDRGLIIDVIRVLGHGEPRAYRLDPAEIERIREAERARLFDDATARAKAYAPGTRVRISTGILEGMTGKVVREAGRERLLVDVQGCSARLPLDFLVPEAL